MQQKNKILLNEPTFIKASAVDYGLYYKFIFAHLQGAASFYPNFDDWFFHKVVPEIERGERQLLIESRNNQIAGLAIVKTGSENKLCTLRIVESFQNKGLGLKLFERCFEELNTCKPFLTVSEEKLPEFERIFKYYGFKLTNTKSDIYRSGKKEFYFNEC